jgi:hypothetical protein
MKILKLVLQLLILCVAMLYLFENAPWLLRASVANLTGIKLASNYYVFELCNDTDRTVIVEVENLNDRKWELLTKKGRLSRENLGLASAQEVKLHPGQKEIVVLPSLKHRSLGIICIFARSDWETFPGVSQECAMILISQDMSSGVHPDYVDRTLSYPVVRIEESDMQLLTEGTLADFGRRSIQLNAETRQEEIKTD